MKILKKIGSVLMVLGLLVAGPLSASASSGINANEQRILDALSAPIQLETRSVVLPAQYINQTRNYMMRAGVDITSSEADQIISYINQARDLVAASGFTQFSDMSDSFIQQLFELVQKAAAIVGLTLSLDLSGTMPVITIVSEAGTVVGDGSDVIKQTGFSFSTSVAVLATLIGVLGACTVVAKKRNFSAVQ